MNVLSLFDGISCARVALGNKIKNYYASEIDKNAIKVALKNFPSTKQLGDVKSIKEDTIKEPIDLLIGGSPCTDLSIAKKGRKGLEGEHSKLFFEYIRVKNIVKPKWFILENVASMKTKDKDIITLHLGVEPIMINASLVSAQSRKRLFWTNIPNVKEPDDRKISLQSILQKEDEIPKDFLFYREDEMKKTNTKAQRGMSIRGRQDLSGNWIQTLDIRKDDKVSALTSACSSKLALVGTLNSDKFVQIGYYGEKNASNVGGQAFRVYDANFKSTTSGVGYYKTVQSIRKLTPIECERLQGLPDNYTEGISKTARYRAIGNGFHVEVIKHIINQI
jgi:DNA-cytosine methyltransferase